MNDTAIKSSSRIRTCLRYSYYSFFFFLYLDIGISHQPGGRSSRRHCFSRFFVVLLLLLFSSSWMLWIGCKKIFFSNLYYSFLIYFSLFLFSLSFKALKMQSQSDFFFFFLFMLKNKRNKGKWCLVEIKKGKGH